jgi:hypothetical protein
MFGATTVPANDRPPGKLTAAVLAFARTQVGQMEDPLGSNRGPQVDRYLRSVGLDPRAGSFAWCVAFTYFCYDSAAASLRIANPHIKTAGALDHWNKAGRSAAATRIACADAVADPSRVTPGCLFIMDFGGGMGHSGIVVSVADGRLVTIEGNTNDNGSRNGIGVFERSARKLAQINKGYIVYAD